MKTTGTMIQPMITTTELHMVTANSISETSIIMPSRAQSVINVASTETDAGVYK